MMARSTTRSNQRPDTLMQDRICQVDETSCNARPDHTLGSKRAVLKGGPLLPVCPDNRTSSVSAASSQKCREQIHTPQMRKLNYQLHLVHRFTLHLLSFREAL